jgi:hypothetical protein
MLKVLQGYFAKDPEISLYYHRLPLPTPQNSQIMQILAAEKLEY